MSETIATFMPPENPDWTLWPIEGGRGSGKTYTALKYLREHLGNYGLVVAHSSDNVRWLMDEMARQLDREGYAFLVNRTRRTIERSPQHQIHFLSAGGDTDSLRGRQFAMAVLDNIDLFPRGEKRVSWWMREIELGTHCKRFITTASR